MGVFVAAARRVAFLSIPDGPSIVKAVGVKVHGVLALGQQSSCQITGEDALTGTAEAIDPDPQRVSTPSPGEPLGGATGDAPRIATVASGEEA